MAKNTENKSLLSLNRRFAAFEDMDLTYLEVRICLATQAPKKTSAVSVSG